MARPWCSSSVIPCPDVCPTTRPRYGEVMKVLGPDADRVQVLFVTLDPRRDDAARPLAFVPWFDPGSSDCMATRRRPLWSPKALDS